jgi:succinate dehydrogenase/fumarate reductase flavoprotein subunit
MDPEDNWMIHAAGTLREGELLADYERVEVLCKNVPDAVNELVGALHENADFSIDTMKASIKDGELKTNQILKNIKMSR